MPLCRRWTITCAGAAIFCIRKEYIMKELLTAKANIDRFLGTEEVHEEPDATKEKEAEQR